MVLSQWVAKNNFKIWAKFRFVFEIIIAVLLLIMIQRVLKNNYAIYAKYNIFEIINPLCKDLLNFSRLQNAANPQIVTDKVP